MKSAPLGWGGGAGKKNSQIKREDCAKRRFNVLVAKQEWKKGFSGIVM